MLSNAKFSVAMLSLTMEDAIMVSVVMLSVVAPFVGLTDSTDLGECC